MANLEELKRKAQETAYAAAEKAQEAAAVAGEKAGVIKDVAKTNVSLVTEKRNLEKCYQALGEWYAVQLGDEAPEGAADLLKAIRDSQAKLEELKMRKSEQDMSARELLDRGMGFFTEKAEAIAALAKKPSNGTNAQDLVAEGVEAFAEKAEELAGEAAEPADIASVHETVEEGVEAAADLMSGDKKEE